VQIVMRLPLTPTVADDRGVLTCRTPARQKLERDHPGSLLSFVSGSAIKRITAGVKTGR
jgi:hypothetical protein